MKGSALAIPPKGQPFGNPICFETLVITKEHKSGCRGQAPAAVRVARPSGEDKRR